MLTKLILLTPESFEKIIKSKIKDDSDEEHQDWYEIRQNMQRYLALRRQKEREESEQRKYKKNKAAKEIIIQTDPIEPKKTLNREVQTDDLLKLPAGIKGPKRKTIQEVVSDKSFSDQEEPEDPKSKFHYLMAMERKKSLRRDPKKTKLYQHGKYYNVLNNWHCFE